MTTPGRRDLADLLTQLIEQSGLSNAEVGRHAGVDGSTVGRWLRGEVTVGPKQTQKVVNATGTAGTELARDALHLAEAIRAGSAYRVVILRSGSMLSQQRYAEYEAAAGHIATFTIAMVPGNLQTEAYMRAVFGAGGQTGKRLEDNVRVRFRDRQDMLANSDRRYIQIVTEGALRRAAAPGVMVEQVEHLAQWARRDTGGRVQVGIVPWHAELPFFPRTNFDLYDENKAVVIGTDFGVAFLDRPADVETYVKQLQRLSEVAVFGETAAVEFDRIASDYRNLETT
jgi:hypothetical protein